jgi:hypothetical protein
MIPFTRATQAVLFTCVVVWVLSLIHSASIKQLYRIENVAIATEYSALLSEWKVGIGKTENESLLGLERKKDGVQIAVSRKNGLVVQIDGSQLNIGPESLKRGASRAEVHAVLGPPAASDNTEIPSEYWYRRNFLGQRVLILCVEYEDPKVIRENPLAGKSTASGDSRVGAYVIQDAGF